MRKSIRRGLIATVAVITITSWGAFAVSALGPSPEQLAADIAEIDTTLVDAREVASKYGPESVLGVQLALRIAVLETTRAMLDQKRLSWLRGIDLEYRVEGRAMGLIDRETEVAAQDEIDATIASAAAAKAKAALYSGGLLQGLALVDEQTQLTTVALIKQRLALARLGMSLPTTVQNAPSSLPAGQIVDDKGAL